MYGQAVRARVLRLAGVERHTRHELAPSHRLGDAQLGRFVAVFRQFSGPFRRTEFRTSSFYKLLEKQSPAVFCVLPSSSFEPPKFGEPSATSTHGPPQLALEVVGVLLGQEVSLAVLPASWRVLAPWTCCT